MIFQFHTFWGHLAHKEAWAAWPVPRLTYTAPDKVVQRTHFLKAGAVGRSSLVKVHLVVCPCMVLRIKMPAANSALITRLGVTIAGDRDGAKYLGGAVNWERLTTCVCCVRCGGLIRGHCGEMWVKPVGLIACIKDKGHDETHIPAAQSPPQAGARFSQAFSFCRGPSGAAAPARQGAQASMCANKWQVDLCPAALGETMPAFL